MSNLKEKTEDKEELEPEFKPNMLENLSNLIVKTAYVSLVPGSFMHARFEAMEKREKEGRQYSFLDKAMNYMVLGGLEIVRLGFYGIVVLEVSERNL